MTTMRYTQLMTEQRWDQPKDARTHRLYFSEEQAGDLMGPSANTQLSLTAEDAKAYTLGELYEIKVEVT